MKSILVLVLFALPLFANAAPKALLVKTVTSGQTKPDTEISYSCRIYPDRVEVDETTGDVTTLSRVVYISMTGAAELALKANKGHITQLTAPGEGQITMFRAFVGGVDSDLKVVMLKSEGAYVVTNDSRAAATLVEVMNTVCDTP